MKVLSLVISRPESYQPEAGKLKGLVNLSSSSGSQTVVLSASAINQIFLFIAKEIGKTAISNAEKVEYAVKDAGQEAIMVETDGQLLIS